MLRIVEKTCQPVQILGNDMSQSEMNRALIECNDILSEVSLNIALTEFITNSEYDKIPPDLIP